MKYTLFSIILLYTLLGISGCESHHSTPDRGEPIDLTYPGDGGEEKCPVIREIPDRGADR